MFSGSYMGSGMPSLVDLLWGSSSLIPYLFLLVCYGGFRQCLDLVPGCFSWGRLTKWRYHRGLSLVLKLSKKVATQKEIKLMGRAPLLLCWTAQSWAQEVECLPPDPLSPLGYLAFFQRVLPNWLVGQVYQGPRVFSTGPVWGWMSWLFPAGVLLECGHIATWLMVHGLSLWGSGDHNAHWATLSHPHLAFNSPGGPSAGEFTAVPGCPWVGSRGSALSWVSFLHGLMGSCGSVWVIESWSLYLFPSWLWEICLDFLQLRHSHSTFLGLPANTGSIKLLPGVGSASGSISSIQICPSFPSASGLFLTCGFQGPCQWGASLCLCDLSCSVYSLATWAAAPR